MRIRQALSNKPLGGLEWKMTCEDDKKRIVKFEKWIKNMQTQRMNELVVQIADLCLGTKKTKVGNGISQTFHRVLISTNMKFGYPCQISIPLLL